MTVSAALADTTIKMVEVITSPPRTELLKKQIASFEQANPGTKVELVSLPWGQAFEKFLTMVQAGDTPDIVEMPERWMGLYANNGQLEDLGPYMAKWKDAGTLGDRAKQFGSVVDNKQYMIPYGYYVRAMFWNKKLFEEAGLKEAPKTLDEFMEANKKISAIQGKYGYCLRGGPGGFNGVQMFMNIANGKGGYFNEDGTATLNEPGAVKGLEMLADIYKNGYAPKDSVSWGFNEVVTGFYSGTCAMLDQDPDALIGIAEKMKHGRFRRRAAADRTERQILSDARLCRLGDVRQFQGQGRRLEADGHTACRRQTTSNSPRMSACCRSTMAPTRTRISVRTASRAGSRN